MTRNNGSGGTVTYSTRTAKVSGTLADGLWVDWDFDDFPYPQLEFDSSVQRPLHVGVFANIQPSPDTGDPTIDDFTDRAFEPLHGEFDVLDLATDSDGHFTRFDIVFITSTTFAPNTVFGEVRLNEDAPSTVVSPSATALRWPLVRRHSDPLWAVETLTNTSTSKVKLGKADLTRGATSDYRIRKDRCSHHTLAPGASCTLQVGFSPTHGGPRDAVLEVPTGTQAVTMSLAGAAAIGTTKLTVTGSYAPHDKKKTTYRDISVDSDYDRTSSTTGYRFSGIVQTGNQPHGFEIEVGGPRPFTSGTYSTHEDVTPQEPYVFGFLLDYRCYNQAGTITIHDFQTDARNVPTEADIDIVQHCDHVTLKGRLQWQDRDDTRAPSKPTKLRITGGKARWTHSSSKDYAATVVRVVPGTGTDATPLNGYPVSSSRATSAALPTLTKGQSYTLLAYSLDETGNASAATMLAFTA
ncbi:hypothetical protein GCM10009593_27110 [Microlunatus antarcticus]